MSAVAVAVAVALDLTLREPPLAVHPVRLMGRLLARLERLVPATPPPQARRRGALAWTAGLGVTVAGAVVVDQLARRAPWPWADALRGVALWPLLSLRLLLDEVAAVEEALGRSLEDGRATVARIVSRDVSAADEEQVRAAALESLAENTSDSFVAPLLWFVAGGLPAAAAYRYSNTADAMWGYRDARWRDAGRAAARADDLANLLPARVTGMALAAPAVPLRRLRAEAGRTPSPNAGWPMAALALRLRIRCAKPGVYVLNAAGRPPTAADTRAGLALVGRTALALAAALGLLAGLGRRPCRR